MREQESLRLACFELPHDTMDVLDEVARDQPVVSITLRNGASDVCSHTLNAEGARALFNWLGVWLHTPK